MLKSKFYSCIYNVLKLSRLSSFPIISKYYYTNMNELHYSVMMCKAPFKTKTVLREINIEGNHFRFHKRSIWGWLNSIFNRVDESRIKDAGPDRACAEWLLRCGAGVKWANSDKFVTDYNSLPMSGMKIFKIEEVDATDSAIMNIGFRYFRNCKHIRKLVLHRASYIDDDSLNELHYLKKSLKELQLSSCGNVTRQGLNHLKILKNLESLKIYDLPQIYDKEEVVKDLQKSLPNCEISFPYARASEISD